MSDGSFACRACSTGRARAGPAPAAPPPPTRSWSRSRHFSASGAAGAGGHRQARARAAAAPSASSPAAARRPRRPRISRASRSSGWWTRRRALARVTAADRARRAARAGRSSSRRCPTSSSRTPTGNELEPEEKIELAAARRGGGARDRSRGSRTPRARSTATAGPATPTRPRHGFARELRDLVVRPVRVAGGVRRTARCSATTGTRRRASAPASRRRRRSGARRRGARSAGWARARSRRPRCPVIFDPETAASLVRTSPARPAGPALYRRASFLLGPARQAHRRARGDDRGRRHASRGALGSRPFDGEGLADAAHGAGGRGRARSPTCSTRYSAPQARPDVHASRRPRRQRGERVDDQSLCCGPGPSTPEELIALASRTGSTSPS